MTEAWTANNSLYVALVLDVSIRMVIRWAFTPNNLKGLPASF
jgi:hypothetical protein